MRAAEAEGPAVAPQTRRVAFLATEEELAMLRSLADDEGLTVSAWIRRTARQSYRRLTASKAKRAVKARTR